MTTPTSLLKLALPGNGELPGTWGEVVNASITSLLDSAIAGATTLSANIDVTLTDTNYSANEARQAILIWTASNGATTRNITAPARSKVYVVINAGTGSIVLRGAGPTTGITIESSERCLAAWNGSDFVKVASTGGLAANSFVLSNAQGQVDTSAVQKAIPSGVVLGTTDTQTLTNKRINPRVSTAASTATLTPDIASFDQVNLTAQAEALTIAAPTGTPVDSNRLIIRLLDNGTSRAITWNGTYRAVGIVLPANTVVGKTTYVGCLYNAFNSCWDVVAVITQA
jgi:hypothetical protein